jgi:small subunit ribosomal protein S3Ae
MAKKVKIKEKRAKKKWFSILAPEVFGKKPLPETPAFEPDELVGRKAEISLKEFTGSPRDSYKKIVCKIIKVQGDTAHTEADKFFLLDSYVSRSSKRYKDSILVVKEFKTKDGKKVKVKSIAFLKNKVQRKVKTNLLRLIEQTLEAQISKKNSQEIFASQFISTIFFSAKKEMKKIYPVDSVLIWKLSVL